MTIASTSTPRASDFEEAETEAGATTTAVPAPWFLLGAGIIATLLLRALIQFDILAASSAAATVLPAVTMAAGAVGAFRLAASRDALHRPVWIDAARAIVAIACFASMFPGFRSGTPTWDTAQQIQFTLEAASFGALFAAIAALALVRRPHSPSTGAFIVASVLLLAQGIAGQLAQLAPLLLLALALGALVASWLDRARPERPWSTPQDAIRSPRWVLSFVAAGVAGTAIELWVYGGRASRSLPGVIVMGLVILGSLVSAFGLRRELAGDEGVVSEWISWRREIRDNEFEAALLGYAPMTRRKYVTEWTDRAAFTAADKAFWRLIGTDEHDLNLVSLVHPEDQRDFSREMMTGLRGRQAFSTRARLLGEGDRPLMWMEIEGEPITPAMRGSVAHADSSYRISLTDVSDDELSRQRDAALEQAAGETEFIDPLTGLPNAAHVDRHLRRRQQRGYRHGDSPLVVVIEISDLEQFEAADERVRDMVVIEAAHALGLACRSTDFVARIDGPYFMLVADQVTDADLDGLMTRIRKLMRGFITVLGRRVQLDGEIAAVRPKATQAFDDLLDECVVALFDQRTSAPTDPGTPAV